MNVCVRCREFETPPDRPYCVSCTLTVRTWIERGLLDIDAYLAKWAAFDAWEDGDG